MNLAQFTEFQVQVFRFKADKKLKWKAQVTAFPQITAEDNSRESVLEKIQEQLAKLEVESEVVSILVRKRQETIYDPAPPIDQELAAKLRAMGYEHFGIFADDPGALELFDDIERLRDQRLIGE